MATSKNPHPQWSKQWIITDKTAVEAGYVNDPSDRGGETNHGITKAVAEGNRKELVARFKWDGNMRNLTKEMAFYIYDVAYWQKLRLDDIHKRCPALADKLFDIGINAGVPTAGSWLQLILNVCNKKQSFYKDLVIDGNIGSVSIAAIDSLYKKRGVKQSNWMLVKLLICKQGAHYVDISFKREANEDFMWGWGDRIDHNLVDYYKALGGI